MADNVRVFTAPNGNQVAALLDVQADAFVQAGMTEVTQKRTRKEQTE